MPSAILLQPPSFSSLNIRQVTFSAGMYSKSFLQIWNSVIDKLQSWVLHRQVAELSANCIVPNIPNNSSKWKI